MARSQEYRRGQVWRDLAIALELVSPPVVKKLILRCIFKAEISRSAHIGWFSAVAGRRIALGEHSRIRPFTVIRCAGDVNISGYAEVSSLVLIYGASGLEVGDHSYIGPQCLIDTTEAVQIGRSSALGPRCMVFTHGSFLPYTEGYPVKFAGVTVGDRAWLAAGVFLHPGVTVGSDVFVNSRAVVTADIPSGGVAEGAPARTRCGMQKFRRHMTSERIDGAISQMMDRFAAVVLEREMGIDVTRPVPGTLSFRHRGRQYLIAHVPSSPNGSGPDRTGSDSNARSIFLANDPKRFLSAAARDFILFDFSTMRTSPSRDPVHTRLFRFMKRYYGLQFEYEEMG